jgi:hypothetical protein
MKCKIVDLHINKQLLNVAVYFYKMGQCVVQQLSDVGDTHHQLTEMKEKEYQRDMA